MKERISLEKADVSYIESFGFHKRYNLVIGFEIDGFEPYHNDSDYYQPPDPGEIEFTIKHIWCEGMELTGFLKRKIEENYYVEIYDYIFDYASELDYEQKLNMKYRVI